MGDEGLRVMDVVLHCIEPEKIRLPPPHINNNNNNNNRPYYYYLHKISFFYLVSNYQNSFRWVVVGTQLKCLALVQTETLFSDLGFYLDQAEQKQKT